MIPVGEYVSSTKFVNLAIAQWIPEVGAWVVQMPSAIPDWVKGPSVISDLAGGHIVERDGEFFQAKHVEPSEVVTIPNLIKVAGAIAGKS